MKRHLSCAALILTAAFAPAQTPPTVQPSNFAPVDPAQKKNALPDTPGVRNLNGKADERSLPEQVNSQALLGMGNLASRDFLAVPLPTQSTMGRMLVKPGEQIGNMFQTTPNEKSNALPDLPTIKELIGNKATNLRDLAPVSPQLQNRAEFKLPTVPSAPK